MKFDRDKIIFLLNCLNDELKRTNTQGEIMIAGGVLMALQYNRDRVTEDIDGMFKPIDRIEAAVKKIAIEQKVPRDWLNNSIKYYLELVSDRCQPYALMRFSNLTVMGVDLETLLSLKLMAFREKDVTDIRQLVILKGIFDWDSLIAECARYVPKERLLFAKMQLQEVFKNDSLVDLMYKHYMAKTNDDMNLARACTDLANHLGMDRCPTIEALSVWRVDQTDLTGTGYQIYLNSLLKERGLL